MNDELTSEKMLIPPLGGELIDLVIPDEKYQEVKAYASRLPSIQISPRFVCDLELLATGALSPLDRFMGREDFQRVLNEMRLSDGHIFPIPISLPVKAIPELHLDQDIALRNNEFELLAIMTVEEIYEWDRTEFADKVLKTQDIHHPVVAEMMGWGLLNISGHLEVLNLPRHNDFQELRLTPAKTRARLAKMGRKDVVAFQPQNSFHPREKEFLEQAIKDVDGTLLLHPAVGLTKLGDAEYYTRIQIYKILAEKYFKPDHTLLSLLPIATRLGGKREALWQALIGRNYGANHIIVNHNHDSPRGASEKKSEYHPNDAQNFVEKYSQELSVKILSNQMRNFDETSNGTEELSSTIYQRSQAGTGNSKNGHGASDWYGVEEITEILDDITPPRHQQGICIWFTGLSGSGKSTTAEMLTWLLLKHGRHVTVLDGDVVRTHLSKGLGFSKEDRDTNVRRIGFVASELVRYGAIVICAVVSPYRVARTDVRNMVGSDQFVEIYVNTPLEVCENRDVKGFYAKARRGEITGFTGIDDPYEPPLQPEITLETQDCSPQENANLILEYLIEEGFVRARDK
ncbi:MAG: adenylyl-sulfate kinase [Anaerolineales bacterium]|jgi:sulfate adenylyltransferase